MGDKADKVTIKIPRTLYNRLRQIVDESGYDSVTDFIVYILRDIVSTHAEEQGEFSPEELQRVKGRLRRLGYL